MSRTSEPSDLYKQHRPAIPGLSWCLAVADTQDLTKGYPVMIGHPRFKHRWLIVDFVSPKAFDFQLKCTVKRFGGPAGELIQRSPGYLL